MARVYLEFDGKNWKEVAHSDFWIDRTLLQKLDNIKKIQRKDWDGLILIDGKERSGKSVLAMICGWYISDCKITKQNYARGLYDAAKKIAEIPDGSVLIMDEASIVFGSKDSAGKQQKLLRDILDVVGQKNLVFIFCNPSFFDLHKTIATRRSLFLLHVYPNAEYERGQYAFWGEKAKAKLYRLGKKNFDSYEFPRAEFVGEFLHFQPPFYQEYINEIKKDSLHQVLQAAVEKIPKEVIKVQAFKIEIAGRLKEKFPKMSESIIGEVLGVGQRQASDYLQAYNAAKQQGNLIISMQIEPDARELEALAPPKLKTFPKTRKNFMEADK